MTYRDSLLQTLPEGRIDSRWFYDRRGSELFERITDLPEYYPTRTEVTLLRRHAKEIAGFVGPNATLVEYGAGNLTKIRLILDALVSPKSYRPLDVSGEFVRDAAGGLTTSYPALHVSPIVASFLDPFEVPARAVGLFLGSTVGNLDDAQIVRLLTHARGFDRFLLGIDLAKDKETLVAAYDDASGITAAFNLNLLARANREADADFDLLEWKHVASWNPRDSRIEMHLESLADQTVTVAGQSFRYAEGGRILTEISRKFTPEQIAPLLAQSGWNVAEVWADGKLPYAVLGLA